VKVVKKIDKLALVAVWVKGGEGRTQDRGVSGASDTNGDANGNQSGVPINAPGGEDEELDAYIGIATYKLENGKVQIFKAWQADSTAADRLPQKDFTDINVTYKALDGKLKLTGEYVKLGGSSPAKNLQGAADGERAVFDAWMYYADANYKTDYGVWGFATGAGSGDNDNTDKRIGGFQSLFIDETHFTYNNLFADDLWGYDLNKAGSFNTSSPGVNNVTWYKFYGIFPNAFMEGLTIAPSYSVMNTTTTPSGISGSNYGSEIDINADFRISKMANLFLKTAYFMPGSYFKDNEINGAKRPDVATKIEAGMAVAF